MSYLFGLCVIVIVFVDLLEGYVVVFMLATQLEIVLSELFFILFFIFNFMIG